MIMQKRIGVLAGLCVGALPNSPDTYVVFLRLVWIHKQSVHGGLTVRIGMGGRSLRIAMETTLTGVGAVSKTLSTPCRVHGFPVLGA